MTASGKDIKSIGDRILAFEGALTAKDVSKLLKIDTDTIYKAARNGEIPSFRVGTSVRFDPKKLNDWYEKQSIR
jgi:excisionase family DNA binding protein